MRGFKYVMRGAAAVLSILSADHVGVEGGEDDEQGQQERHAGEQFTAGHTPDTSAYISVAVLYIAMASTKLACGDRG